MYQDLIKPQWVGVIHALKRHGSLPAGELARQLDAQYMTVKLHCEQLVAAGYLAVRRMPRAEIGRPELFYQLTAKADELFPQAGVDFSISLLQALDRMSGSRAVDQLLFQYFQSLTESMEARFSALGSVPERAQFLVSVRNAAGHRCDFLQEESRSACLIEWHNPLGRLFQSYPRALAFEKGMIERLLGVSVSRSEHPCGRDTTPHVVFELLGNVIQQ
ncbi:MAG: helix-turn-helix transcriptional regulator [Luteolibacter sp.]